MLAAFAGSAVSCKETLSGFSNPAKAQVPIPAYVRLAMKIQGMTAQSPIMVRIFKEENVLEVWKQKPSGEYAKLVDLEICKWSGEFGPKLKEGDRQAPEGFYSVARHQLNPRSQYHLAFNMGYPNAYDRAHRRTGAHLMIHGDCSSAGCYSMTDGRMETIYALAREALKGGQEAFQVQAFPFRMTARNMAKHHESPNFAFWSMLKKGYDHFELTRKPPKVDVCGGAYVFNTESSRAYNPKGACPKMTMPQSLALAFTARQNREARAFEAALAKEQNRPQRDVSAMTLAQALPGVSMIPR